MNVSNWVKVHTIVLVGTYGLLAFIMGRFDVGHLLYNGVGDVNDRFVTVILVAVLVGLTEGSRREYKWA